MVGRRRSCKNEINKGTWSKEEDETLFGYVTRHGEGKWREVAQHSGLKRCAKSCRYRYLNYLKPGIKRGDISGDEEDLIIRLHNQLGKRWALIARKLPGRTDIEIKNYWKIYLSKKLRHERRLEEKKSGKMLLMLEDSSNGSSDYSTSMSMNNPASSASNIQTEEDDDFDDNMYEYDHYEYVDDDNNDEKVDGRHGLKGAWSKKEDEILSNYVALHGEGKWNKVAQKTGLKRCGKSCRHRYLHYLKPGIKRGNISKEEEDMIIKLHQLHGNRWTLIAKKLPGRTDSEIKNYWHAYLSKKLQQEQESSSPSSPTQYLQYPETKYTQQMIINGSVYAPEVAVPISTITNNNNNHNLLQSSNMMMMMGLSENDDHNSTNNAANNSFEIEYDDAFLDDFLFNIFQNDQIGGADHGLDSKMMPQIEEEEHHHNMVVASSSFSPQLSEDVMDFWTSSEFPFFDC